METRLSLEPRRALARFVALLTGGDIGRRPDDAIRLDALGLGPITPLLAGAPEEAHPDLGETCAPFRTAGETPSRILLLALAEAITEPRPLELRERALFHRIASLLGMHVAEASEILKLASRGHAAVDAGADPHVVDARRLLGVGANATADAVDAAYLARVARFNPAARSRSAPARWRSRSAGSASSRSRARRCSRRAARTTSADPNVPAMAARRPSRSPRR